MILIYRIAFFAVMYAGVAWLIVRYLTPSFYDRLVNRYRDFEHRIETADVRPALAWCDLVSKIVFVTAFSMLAVLVLACLIAEVLHPHLAR